VGPGGVVAGQRVGGERLEGLLQLGVAAHQQLLAVRPGLPLAGQRGVRGRRVGLGAAQPLGGPLVLLGEFVDALQEPGALGAQPGRGGPGGRRGVGGGARGVRGLHPGAGGDQAPRDARSERRAHQDAQQQHREAGDVHAGKPAPGYRQDRVRRAA
jgi:hypothetical protein